MSASEFKQELSSNDDANRSWFEEPMEASPLTTLMKLGIALANAPSSPSLPGQCAKCRSYRSVQSSTAEFPSVFCSEQCEQIFIRTTLARLTVEDCIRIHGRLEKLIRVTRWHKV
jgi:hypothetical protein